MKRYKGKEPCAGCGRSGMDVPRNLLSDLCHECWTFLRIGRAQKPEPDKFARVNWTTDGLGDLSIEYYNKDHESIKSKYRFTEKPRYQGDGWDEIEDGKTRKISDAFIQLLTALDRGECETSARLLMRDSYHRHTYYIPLPIAEALFEIYRQLSCFSRVVYADGHSDGNDLLVGLAAGTKTIDEINSQVARVNEYGAKNRH